METEKEKQVKEAILYLETGDYEEAALIARGLANGNFDEGGS